MCTAPESMYQVFLGIDTSYRILLFLQSFVLLCVMFCVLIQKITDIDVIIPSNVSIMRSRLGASFYRSYLSMAPSINKTSLTIL